MMHVQILRLVWRSKNLQHPSVLPVLGVMWSLPSVPQNMAVLVTECQELGVLSSFLTGGEGPDALLSEVAAFVLGFAVIYDHSWVGSVSNPRNLTQKAIVLPHPERASPPTDPISLAVL
eukprot:1156475-Pelagomonas_calceolata.AAC.3